MNFFKKHPIITNLILVIVVSLLLVWGILAWLKVYTRHDKTVVIPVDLIGMPLEEAKKVLAQKKLRFEETSPVYIKNATPGTVCRVWPPEGTNVKEGRIISLTAYSDKPPQISMPEVKDISQRQALALLKSVGFENVSIRKVDGAYRDLVIGVESNGKPIYTGVRYDNNLPITLLVSSGSDVQDEPIPGGITVPEEPDETPPDESWF